MTIGIMPIGTGYRYHGPRGMAVVCTVLTRLLHKNNVSSARDKQLNYVTNNEK